MAPTSPKPDNLAGNYSTVTATVTPCYTVNVKVDVVLLQEQLELARKALAQISSMGGDASRKAGEALKRMRLL